MIFYTPQEVVDIIVRYLKPQQGDTIYDPTCGSGGFLLNAAKYAKVNYHDAKSIRLFGQELVWNTWAICNINIKDVDGRPQIATLQYHSD